MVTVKPANAPPVVVAEQVQVAPSGLALPVVGVKPDQLQDTFDSRRIADRLEQVTLHDRFSDGDRAYVERWNGTRWTVQRTPTSHFQYTELTAVSCWSVRGCVAVGDSSDGLRQGAFIDRVSRRQASTHSVA